MVGATTTARPTTSTGEVDPKRIVEGGGGCLEVPPGDQVILVVLEVSF